MSNQVNIQIKEINTGIIISNMVCTNEEVDDIFKKYDDGKHLVRAKQVSVKKPVSFEQGAMNSLRAAFEKAL